MWTGTQWEQCELITLSDSTDDRAGMLIFETSENDKYSYMNNPIWWVRSGVYLNDSTTPINFEAGECTLVKYGENQWYIDGLPTEPGTTVRIDYCLVTYQWNSPKILFLPTAFVYNADGTWSIKETVF